MKKAKNTKSGRKNNNGALLFERVREYQRTSGNADAGVSKKKLIELTRLSESQLKSQLDKFAKKIKQNPQAICCENYPSARWESFGKKGNLRYKVTDDRVESSTPRCHEGHSKGKARATVTAKKGTDEKVRLAIRGRRPDHLPKVSRGPLRSGPTDLLQMTLCLT